MYYNAFSLYNLFYNMKIALLYFFKYLISATVLALKL